MIVDRRYEPWELTYGVCKCCGEESDEILMGDGRCVDCIESERFYNETMNGSYDEFSFKYL